MTGIFLRSKKSTPKLKVVASTVMSLAATAMMLQSSPASAGGLGDLINNMFIASGGPGVYRSQQGMMLQGGYADIKIPNQAYNVISFAPPNLSMGCGGINLFLGSFSFISAQQFVAMLKNIGEGLISVAFYTAISTMCNHCEAILSALQQAMQDMNALTKGTCQAGSGINLNGVAKSIGAEIGNDAKDALGFNGTDSGVTNAETNNTQTPGDAMREVGSQVKSMATDAWNSLKSAVNWDSNTTSTTTPTSTAPLGSATSPTSSSADHSLLGTMKGIGNNTWNALRTSDAQEFLSGVGTPLGQNNSTITMELIMSILGSVIESPPGVRGGISAAADASAGTPSSKNSPDQNDLAPILNVQQLLTATPSELNDQNLYTCQSVSGNNTSYPAYGLKSGDIHVNQSCLVAAQASLSSQNILSIQSYVQVMMLGGTLNGVSHTGLLDTIKSNSALTPNEKNFIDNSGVPFYALALKINNIDPKYVGQFLAQTQPILVAAYSVKLLEALQNVINQSFGEDSKAIHPPGLAYVQSEIPTLIDQNTVIANKVVHLINSNERFLTNYVQEQNATVKDQ